MSQFEQGGTTFLSGQGGHVRLPVGSLQRFETEAAKAIGELDELAQTHQTAVFCENEGERQRFSELLEQKAPGLSEKIELPIGYLHRGFVWEEVGAGEKPLALLGHHELFHRYEQAAPRRQGCRLAPH